MKQPHSPPSKLQLVYSSVQNLSCSGICLILLGGINIPSSISLSPHSSFPTLWQVLGEGIATSSLSPALLPFIMLVLSVALSLFLGLFSLPGNSSLQMRQEH